MKTAEDFANEIVEQVNNGASVSDVIQLLENFASQFNTVEPEKEEKHSCFDNSEKHENSIGELLCRCKLCGYNWVESN